jgi:TonB family protein
VDEYCSLLAKVALQNNGYVLANHFTNSFTLKRITMMKTVRRKIKNWKVLAAACTLPLFFFVVACQDQVANVEKMNNNIKSDVIYPNEVQNALNQLKNSNPDSEFIVIEKNKTGDQILETLNQDNISIIQAQGYANPFAIVSQGATTLKRKNSNTEVFNRVEQSAEPVGGMPQFYDHIGANLKYPEQARKMGVEGRVFVEFVVNEDGTISDVKTVKGIGAGCDMEAARVVALSKAWNPAKNKGQMVKQRMVVPIIFKLG